MLRAAAGKVEITPPVGVRMAGFDDAVSLAVHDPLWARCLVLENDVSRVALISMDLLFAESDLVSAIRTQASAATSIPSEAILVASTHTHSGPRRAGDDGTPDEEAYWKDLPRRVAGLVAKTAAQLAPARVSAASGWAAIGVNRRERTVCGKVILGSNELGVFDPELGVVRLDRADGTPLAALLNFACHGVCLVHDNRLLSGDYPGYASRLLEERLGGNATALFFNGAGGNINPREKLTIGGERYYLGTFLLAQRAGNVLAEEAHRVWAEAQALKDPALSHVVRTVDLPVNAERALRWAEGRLREAEREAASSPEPQTDDPLHPHSRLACARRCVQKTKERGSTPERAELQALAVGPLAFIGWPGEVFCELGMALKRRSPFKPTYVLGYANGSIGYVPTPAAYAEGGYEVDSAQNLADHAGEVLVEESARLLEELHRGALAPGPNRKAQ